MKDGCSFYYLKRTIHTGQSSNCNDSRLSTETFLSTSDIYIKHRYLTKEYALRDKTSHERVDLNVNQRKE